MEPVAGWGQGRAGGCCSGSSSGLWFSWYLGRGLGKWGLVLPGEGTLFLRVQGLHPLLVSSGLRGTAGGLWPRSLAGKAPVEATCMTEGLPLDFEGRAQEDQEGTI